MADAIMKEWDVYVVAVITLSDGLESTATGHIGGPRVGLCSNSIQFQRTKVDATGKGCSSN